MSGEWSYVIASYAITWVVIVGYGVQLARRIRKAADADEAARLESAR